MLVGMISKAIARKVAILPCVSQVVLTNGIQSTLIKKDDRVFIVPPGKPTHRDDFQIACVNEIRGGENAASWFRVQLYEGIRESPTNPNDLAPTELILGSKEYWLPSNKILDNCHSYYRTYDDAIPNPPRMNSKIWFSRRLKTQCNVCLEIYKPHKDRQRYCYACRLWFHLQCVGDAVGNDFGDPKIDFHTPGRTTEGTIDIEAEGDDGFPVIFNEVIQQPSVRGHGGEYNWDNNWLITGSGVQKGLIARWREEDCYPDDWLKLFGENFLQDFVIEKRWKFYACPHCASNI